jgi:hypothetical protein
MEPKHYWDSVPNRVFPFMQFMNTPVVSNKNEKHSVLRMIQNLVKKDDFVSFKLDIDTPEVELPIVLELLRNKEIAEYIDEFFFELHFHCEVLSPCCWYVDKNLQEFFGFRLYRNETMHLFQQLRYYGTESFLALS